MAAPPAGFIHLPLGRRGGMEFTAMAGPWFAKAEGERLVGGFRVLTHHQNPNRVCHGGMLATFCDVMIAMSAAYEQKIDALLPTVSLSLDYLEPTPGGAWVEIRTDVLRRGKRMVFAQALLTVERRPTVRANGVFSVPSVIGDGPAMSRYLRMLLAPA